MADSYDELLPVLKKATIFAGLDEGGLRMIVNRCEVISARAGEVIIAERTPATEIFVVLSGSVKITLDQQNNPLEICTYGVGDCIGEASVIGVSHHSASAVVVEDATFLILSRKVLMELFEQDKAFFAFLILNIARELARRLRRTDEMLMDLVKRQRNS